MNGGAGALPAAVGAGLVALGVQQSRTRSVAARALIGLAFVWGLSALFGLLSGGFKVRACAVWRVAAQA